MSLGFKIQFLNIYESYFKGKVENEGREYTINIQNERRGKVLKLPLLLNTKKDRILVRLTGHDDIFIEDLLPYKGNQNGWKLTLMKLLSILQTIRTNSIHLKYLMNSIKYHRNDFK